MSTKKTAIYIHNQFEEVEAITVVDLLRRAKIEIDMVAIGEDLSVIGSHGISVDCDIFFTEAKAKKKLRHSHYPRWPRNRSATRKCRLYQCRYKVGEE